MTSDTPTNDPLYKLGLALLEVIDKPIALELEQPKYPEALALQGTLIRAFDTPGTATLSVMVGAETITIRLAAIKQIHITRDGQQRNRLKAVHLLLNDNYALHLKPLNTHR